MLIKDSGHRTEFESGAVRDIQEGKGRCDLLPLDIVEELLLLDFPVTPSGTILEKIDEFEKTGKYRRLIDAAFLFIVDCTAFPDMHTAVLEYAVHLEEGAKKYGDRNWQKGIPTERYVDSAVRHYLKYLRGDSDERHDRAFIWNLLCGAWTAKHFPELNNYPY